MLNSNTEFNPVGQKSAKVFEIALSENIEKLQGELETIRKE